MTTAKQVEFLLAGYRHPTTNRPLAGGKVETFLDGTSTLSALWTDANKGGVSTNPVILDSAGKAEVYGDNIYKFRIYDSSDIFIEEITGLEYQNVLKTKNEFATISDLRAVTGTVQNETAKALGYYNVGDGGGGPDRYWSEGQPPGTYTDNGGSIIVPNGGDGSAAWLMQENLPIQNVLWWGVKNDASIDAFAQTSELVSVAQKIEVPQGVYLNNSITYTVDAAGVFVDKSFIPGVNIYEAASKSAFTLTGETPDTTPLSGLDARTILNITAVANGANHADCIRLTLNNKSTDGNGNTGLYSRGVSDTNSMWTSSKHGETRHAGGTTQCSSAEAASYSTTGAFFGATINYTNGSAESTHPLTGNPLVIHPTATALAVIGTETVADWFYGIHFRPNSIRSTGITILDEGNANFGIVMNGNYTSETAIRIKAGNYIAFEASNQIKLGYDSGASQVKFKNGNDDRVGINITANPFLAINGQKVISERATGWGQATGTPTRTAFNTSSVTLSQLAERVKALIDDLFGHGLIGS